MSLKPCLPLPDPMLLYTNFPRIIAVLLGAACLVVLSVSTRNKVVPGVFVGPYSVAGKSPGELKPYLDNILKDYENSQITLFVNDSDSKEKIDVSMTQLGIYFDSERTGQKAYSVGRSGNTYSNLIFKFKGFFVKTQVVPVYRLNSSQFASTLHLLLAKHMKDPSDATIELGRNFTIKPDASGKTYNLELTSEVLRSKVENLSSDPVIVQFVEVLPRVEEAGARRALEKVKTLDNQRVTLSFDRQNWSLSGQNLLNALDFKPRVFSSGDFDVDLGYSSLQFLRTDYPDAGMEELDVVINDEYLDDFIKKIGDSLDVETIDAAIVFDGQKITQFTPARDGQRLDRELTKDLLLEKFSVESVSGEKEIVINLPVTTTKAKIENDEINSLGIKELIGRGVSYFGGSIQNRIFNLSLGSQRISGTLVKPGEVFSFNKSVGEVSGATGYKPAYVISSGRTVLDDGGGICQVSTTIFRAALNAGLPIVSRTAHAYRVGYYEQGGFKPGMDATVWSPAVDFVFKNDTDRHILVQAVVDPVNAKLQVDIYGTGDGRKSEISTPVISNVSPAPPERRQDDPSLPEGTVKQVDFAAGGATSVFGRKVYKGDSLIIDESFKSVYRPWQAVYLVGTGG